jgi:hypothetical protein
LFERNRWFSILGEYIDPVNNIVVEVDSKPFDKITHLPDAEKLLVDSPGSIHTLPAGSGGYSLSPCVF